VASLEFTETFAKYIPAVQKRNLLPTAHSTVNAAEYAEIELAPNTAATETVRIQAVFPASGTRKLTLVLYKDPVVYQEETYYLDAQDDIVQLSLSEPLTGELRYGEQTLPVYLEPGDDIQLKFDPVQFEQSLTFEGRGAANNNYLKANRSALRKIQKDVNTNVRYANPTDYRKFMDEQYASRKAFLTNFPQREEWSAAFTTFAQADIDYWYGFYLLNYAWEHPLYNDQATPMSLPASYYDFTHKLALNKDGILTNKYYSFYLEQYIAYQLDQADNQGMSELDLAKMHLNGESYYYYQTKLLVASCRRGQAKEAGWVIKDFVKKCPYPVFNQVLSDTYHHARGLVEGTNAPDFTLTDVNGQQVSLSDYKGKVVFIDFWATWCAPCIRYMRHTQRMAQQFANDDVVFLYISLDRDKQNWEQQVNLKNLHGVHLTAGNGSGYQSHIAQLYRVKRLPTYVLIDRDGKVAISPENMPSTAQLTGAISRLLTQN
ncbi:MAG: TlpA disulfide reductase family protein, partial [Bacteroidota bacterium]